MEGHVIYFMGVLEAEEKAEDVYWYVNALLEALLGIDIRFFFIKHS